VRTIVKVNPEQHIIRLEPENPFEEAIVNAVNVGRATVGVDRAPGPPASIALEVIISREAV
jgi:hypothetical protein